MTGTMINIAGIVLAVAIIGCSKDSPDNTTERTDFPERIGGTSDATAGDSFGLLNTDSSENIVVDLSKLPEYASPNLWACFQFPADNFVLGEAVCAGDASKKTTITAAAVAFTCIQNPDFTNRSPKTALIVDGCTKLETFIFKFSPALAVTLSE